MMRTGRVVSDGIGTPILIREKRRGSKGVLISQGTSYINVALDEVETVIACMREIADSAR